MPELDPASLVKASQIPLILVPPHDGYPYDPDDASRAFNAAVRAGHAYFAFNPNLGDDWNGNWVATRGNTAYASIRAKNASVVDQDAPRALAATFWMPFATWPPFGAQALVSTAPPHPIMGLDNEATPAHAAEPLTDIVMATLAAYVSGNPDSIPLLDVILPFPEPRRLQELRIADALNIGALPKIPAHK